MHGKLVLPVFLTCLWVFQTHGSPDDQACLRKRRKLEKLMHEKKRDGEIRKERISFVPENK